MARSATRLAAVAFVLGMSLAGRQAVAAADTPNDETAAGPANTSQAAAGQHGRTAIAARGERAAAPAAAATESPTGTARSANAGTLRSARAAAERAGSDSADARAARTAPAAVDNSTVTPGRPSIATPEPPSESSPAVSNIAAPVDVSAVSPPDVPAPAAQVATVSVSAAAATADSVADLLGGALAPLQSFLEGFALLVRRTFFNNAPTVTPIQLTGQTTGAITGNLGAVDPDGDPITYTVTTAPVFGTVTVASDGSYSYTPGDSFAGTDTFTVAAADSGMHINLLNLLRPGYTVANAVVTQGLTGPRIQFEFNYTGGALLWSQEARAALESSATILGSYFVVSAPVTVTYAVTGELSPLSGTLASASSDITSSRAGFFPTVVQQKIQSGVDANGAAPDGEITWNFGSPWAFGATVVNGQYDFQSVALHELLHTFGFLSNVSAPGTNTDTGWTTFDSFLVTADRTKVIGSTNTWNSAYNTNLTGGNGGLYFGGPAALAAYGSPVPIFTPSSWLGGSSISHLDDSSFYGRNDQLMNSRVSMGKGIRTLSAVETAILTDLGYTMVPTPLAAGFLVFGAFFLRRRRET